MEFGCGTYLAWYQAEMDGNDPEKVWYVYDLLMPVVDMAWPIRVFKHVQSNKEVISDVVLRMVGK